MTSADQTPEFLPSTAPESFAPPSAPSEALSESSQAVTPEAQAMPVELPSQAAPAPAPAPRAPYVEPPPPTYLYSDAKLIYADLLSVFAPQKLAYEKIGLELEKFASDAEGRPLPVEGERSVQAVLEGLEKRFGWKAERQGPDGTIISLRRRGESVSVEPGGQIEYATTPGVTLDAAFQAEQDHLQELSSVTEGWGISWCASGVRPSAGLNEVGWIPKRRYEIMRDYMAGRGELAHWMMKMTASVQVSIDYRGEADAAQKLNLAARLVPVLTAISAASPITLDQPNGFKSYRSHIWTKTDPDRCGLPDCLFKPDFKFSDYVEYALDVPVFFIVRGGESIPLGRLTFREFLAKGHAGHHARIDDWHRHLTFLFPEVRLKNYIEIRCCDRLPDTLSFAVAALIKALLYSEETRAEAAAWIGRLSADEVRAGLAEAAQHGLKGTMAGRSLGEWAKEAVILGRKGLKRLQATGRSSDAESRWYEGLERMIVEDQTTLADVMLAAWNEGQSIEEIVRL